MTKNVKKPSNLNMGGVLRRKPRVDGVQKTKRSPMVGKKPEPEKSKIRLKTFTPAISKKKLSRPKSIYTFLKNRILYLVIPAAVLFLYLFKIRTLPPLGNSGSLSISHNNLSDIDSIDFLPIKLVTIISDKAGITNPLDIRLFSVLLALLASFFFYKLMLNWLGRRMAVIAVLLYASSTWILAQSRHDSEFIMLAVFIPTLLYLGGLIVNSGSKIVRIICSLILVQFIFIPGAIWFILGSAIAILLRKEGRVSIKRLLLPTGVMALAIIGYCALLFHLSLTGLSQLLRIAGLQIGEIPSGGTIKANMIELPSQLFMSGLNDSAIWLYRTPLIDWISVIFLIVGAVYLISAKRRSFRVKCLAMLFLLSILLIFANGPYYVSLLLPLTYIVIATGIAYLSRLWLNIFPNNPLARGLGTALICASVLMIGVYHVERYFIGWPKTETYKQIYGG